MGILLQAFIKGGRGLQDRKHQHLLVATLGQNKVKVQHERLRRRLQH